MIPSLSKRLAAAVAALLLTLAATAQAAAPTRVARLGFLEGEVSFLEAGDANWVQASLNRPLTTGDRLWTDSSSVAELQLEGAAIRMGERSQLSVLNLDPRITQLELSQGALRLRLRALGPEQSIEVDTPNLAMVLRRVGDYRIEVDPQGDTTLVLVQSGQAEVFGEAASYRVESNQTYRFYGNGLSDYEMVYDYRADALDRWAQQRERRLDSSPSARYVPAGVVGYEDLDANGRWVVDADYGNVWLPSRVDAGWTPYRDGRWTWVEPWGWTWIDDAPWGYAVSHYGRWAYLHNAWCWVPGPVRERVVYAPALVVFVGGNQVRRPPERHSGMGNIAWVPLAPREVYRVDQAPSREGYANQHVRGAVVAAVNQPPRERTAEAPARSRPPRIDQPVLARTAPPAPVAAPVPGRPASPMEAPVRVRVIPPAAAATPSAVPPPTPRSELPRAERRPEAARPAAPAAVPPVAPPAAAAAPAAPTPAPTRVEPARVEPPRNDAGRNDAGRNDALKNDAVRNEAARAEALRNEAAKNDAARAEAGRADAARAEAARAEAARAEAGRAEAARNAAAQAEAARARAAQEQAARAAEANRNNAALAEAARARAAQEQAARAEAAKAEAARQPGHNADAQRGNGQKPQRELTPEEELLRAKRKQEGGQ